MNILKDAGILHVLKENYAPETTMRKLPIECDISERFQKNRLNKQRHQRSTFSKHHFNIVRTIPIKTVAYIIHTNRLAQIVSMNKSFGATKRDFQEIVTIFASTERK